MGWLVSGLKLIALILLAWIINAALGYETKVDSLILLSITVAWMKTNRVGVWLFAALVLTATFYIPVSWNYAHPNLTIVSSLIETNSSEALEFFKDLEVSTLAIAAFFAVVSFSLFRFVPKIQGMKTSIFFFVLFSFLLLDKPVRTIADRNIEDHYTQALLSNMRYAPVRFFYDWYDSYNKYHQYNAQIMAQREIPSSWVITNKPQQAKNTIFVIGESVRKDYMNAYGFSLDNTPFMSTAKGELWQDFLSPGPNTFTSVMRFVTLNDGVNIELNNNINTLAKAADIETFWISNQGRMGEFDTGISAIANYADHVSFTRSGSFRDSNIYDSILLKKVEQALASSSKSKLIVVHLIGSHPRFCDRVEGEVKFDFNGDKISCYIESIKQTDSLLAEIDAMAQQQASPYSLLYVSDHGLGHRDNGQNLRHDPEVKQSYQVPLFITGSSFESRELVQSPRNGFALIKALSELMGISSQQLDALPSFFSPYKDKPIVNNGEGELISLDALKDDSIHM
ncbi:putative Dca [Vibrio ichthyoenteri ATCC 700023]|uniref:Putative Dca n=1 Tax=Vibrio ichthyoenteri ATCC 700023 TaxID=870968 RepID=F9S4K6_9VIBR|nr:phosphoethanolamine transferase [Vibrio ichthyoenteri]EGU36696.1 putative Dca [Vibrio ichthyoenteri ATCC 700023]